MTRPVCVLAGALLTLCCGALPSWAGEGGLDFQIRYVSNLNVGDSIINITNDGEDLNIGVTGNICVGVYSFDASEELLSCCACQVTPDGLVSISAQAINATNLTPEVPTALVIKLVAWYPYGESWCNAAEPGSVGGGLQAWATTLHALPSTPVTYGVTETAFSPATLSVTELEHITQFCQFNQANGTGFGQCKGCNPGAAGATAQQ